ncbi:hypothetical protein D3I60_00350 [Brevibacterium permense]|uniref:hypothetical protein n=1 Tax=Brevibacterium permense TaxID=234834 RepID=UPI0021D2AD81|nr:hypothetical protein [Brevibacterium permense]MCU4295544.1 hypothetical protein [Brevibacterium permense]
MPRDYSPERIAAMADELSAAAHTLGVPLADTRPAVELVSELLVASARWSDETGTRASGPFGTFLAGCVDGADRDDQAVGADRDRQGLEFVDSLVNGLGLSPESE